MPGILDTVQRAFFDDIPFACSGLSVKGGLRESVHEYRNTPGGDPEIQGRRLYTIEFAAIYSAEMPDYPNAYPGNWEEHRSIFEQGLVRDLVVPTLGIVKAYCTDWPFDVDFKSMRDGLKAKLTFREDSTNLTVNGVQNVSAIYYWSTPFLDEVEAAGLKISIFDLIMGLLADIEAYKEFGEFVVELYLDKVSALIDACVRLEESVTELNDPSNWKVARMIRAIGVDAIRIKEDALRRLAPMIDFVVPALMSVIDISIALYGDTSHAMDLLTLNRDPPLPDAFAIVPGTVVHAYAPQL